MRKSQPVDVSKTVRDEPAMRRAIQRATLEARQRHKQAGLPVSEWRDGKVVWIPADQIEAAPNGNGRAQRASTARKSGAGASRSAKKKSRSKAS